MSALDDMGAAILRALDECPTDEVLSVVTGTFVSLVSELMRQHGHCPDGEIKIDGRDQRDITIHAKKGAP